MAEEIGKIKYTLTLDVTQFEKGMQKASDTADKDSKKVSSKLSKIGAVATKAGAVAAAGVGAAFGAVSKGVMDIAKQAIEYYAEYEQLTGGVEQLYGKGSKAAGIILKNADEAYKTAGMNANTYIENVTSFSATLLKSLGGDGKKAAEVANMAIIDMADNANTFGTSMESITWAYQGFAKQNYTMLDNLKLGYAGTKEGMELLLADAQKLTGQKYDISNLNDVFNAIHAIQGQLKITGKTAEEAEKTISGSIATTKAAWEDVLIKLASGSDEEIKVAVDNFIASFGNMATRLEEILPPLVDGLVTLIDQLIPYLQPLIDKLVPPLLDLTMKILGLLGGAILNGVGGWWMDIFTSAGNFTTQLLEIFMQCFFAVGDFITNMISGMVEMIGLFIGAIVAGVKGLVNNVKKIIGTIVGAVKTIIDKIAGFFNGLFTKISQIWGKIVSTIKGFAVKIGDAVGGAIKGAINGVLGFVEGALNTPIRAINGLIDVINAVPGISIGHLNELHLPRLAAGGIVPAQTGGHIIMAGEAGQDEWVVPESKMASLIDQIQSHGGATGNVTINVSGIYATSEKAKRDVATDIWAKLQEVNKSRMGAMGL